jgi:REP element-mobilizing transposase RayT
MKQNTNAIVEQYLSDISAIHATRANVAETSFYPALATLLNAVGATLAPKVRCIIHLKNRGEGLPDGGLFTAEQFKNKRGAEADDDTIFTAQLPARGVLEVKAPGAALLAVAQSDQVKRYWERHGLVLVTNLHAFVLVGKDQNGQPALLETYALCATAEEFWRLAAHPQSTAKRHGAGLVEYLLRVLLHNAPLASPQDVAGILASYARDAKTRVEQADVPALVALRTALEESLGLHFTGEKGDHFFRSTLVQTLFYGVFSAWVIWARRHAAQAKHGQQFKDALNSAGSAYAGDSEHFQWHMAGWFLRVPMIRALFEQVATPSKLGPLGLVEVLDWTAAALNRVDQAGFFKAFDEGHAVQYFYEPFLQAFDPELRKDLGVWYTPSEIVDYQVERVDTVLREELNIPDGLADARVVVLDPCCGTAAYLRSVLCRIAKTLHEKGGDALVAHDLKKAAIERVFGFEILPAPFVISHLQIGLLLESLGAPLSDAKNERIGVYLTNALTGWEPPKDKAKQQIMLPELAEERDAAERVKQEKPILVILGNPPYNAFAGVSPEEENDLVEPYKKGLNTEWGIKKFNLDDLYVRFFRLAEKRIAEKGGRGVVSFISNFSYLGDSSFVVMRKRFYDEFDTMWFDCMNGDSRKTGKLTPDGKPDPSVFSTEWNSEGIRVGTTISVLVKRGVSRSTRVAGELPKPSPPQIRFRHFWGASKRQELVASVATKDFNAQYKNANPSIENRWSFRPSDVTGQYLAWPRLTDLCAQAPINGLMEKRGGALIDSDRAALESRMRRYFDETLEWHELVNEAHALVSDAAGYDAKKTRVKVLGLEKFDQNRIKPYALRAFEQVWCYYTPVNPLWNRPRPSLWAQCWEGNKFFMTRPAGVASPEGVPFYATHGLGDNDFLRGHAYYFPMRLRIDDSSEHASLPGLHQTEKIIANLSELARNYLASLGLPDPDTDQATAELIWLHALAIGYSPVYLKENADGIRQDWPRIPLPASKEALLASAELGRIVAALLDTETPVPGVTAGTIPDDLKSIAVFTRVDGQPVNPDAGDLDLTAGWGHAGKAGVTMPGKGKISRTGGPPVECPTCGTGGPPVECRTGGPPVECRTGGAPDDESVTTSQRPIPQFTPFDRDLGAAQSHRHLPHWRQELATYFVTWCLGDSIPAVRLAQWRNDREQWLKLHAQPWTPEEVEDYRTQFADCIEEWLDEGQGDCVLADPRVSAIVEECLLHFAGERYGLWRYAIMPNHVHVLVTPAEGFALSAIMHTWKSYTAKRINALLGRTGMLWQDASFDHSVRDQAHLEKFIAYIDNNPVKASLHCKTGSTPVKTETTGQRPVPLDIYLNNDCCWRNIPEAVWDYTIGGYQVIKKWLSYREKPLLGRGLTIEEVRYVTDTARRLAALARTHDELDKNYQQTSERQSLPSK